LVQALEQECYRREGSQGGGGAREGLVAGGRGHFCVEKLDKVGVFSDMEDEGAKGSPPAACGGKREMNWHKKVCCTLGR
jgi:hypothetical protein